MKTTLINLISLFWQDLINLLHIFDQHDRKDQSVNSHSKELRKEGITKIRGFLDAGFCDELRKEIEMLQSIHLGSTETENGTIINYRGKGDKNHADHGMLDIFYVENSIPSVLKADLQKLIRIVESCTGQKVIPLRVNAYINDGVENTRKYHVDNVQPTIYKAFIYLTNVPDLSYGPYSFVRRSHRFSWHVYFNIFRNLFIGKYRSTDMSFFNRRRIDHGIGKKGDMILSNQNAIHRGLPQETGKKRIALVYTFLVRSKLNYLHKTARLNIKNSTLAVQKQRKSYNSYK